jgi:flavin reductase (DIM6/NTAB) family NADH-FMN oxidoreductase RutF
MSTNDKFKDAMSLVPTSVAIVWLRDEQNQFFGCTISSLISVSVIQDCEEVAFILRTNSKTGERIRNSKNFNISILNRNQESIAKIFSQGLLSTDLNVAIKANSMWFEESVCEFSLSLKQEITLENSTIFVASVKSFSSRPNLQPLIYSARKFQ